LVRELRTSECDLVLVDEGRVLWCMLLELRDIPYSVLVKGGFVKLDVSSSDNALRGRIPDMLDVGGLEAN
jgi:hypothetical protein